MLNHWFRSKGIPTDLAAYEAASRKLNSVLDILDQLLDKQEFFGGSNLSLIDTFYMPTVGHLYHAGEGAAFESRSNLKAWWAKVSARESWKKIN